MEKTAGGSPTKPTLVLGVEPGADCASRLKVDFPEDPTMRISHEAIYQALYVQGRGALKRELSACLRSGRAVRLPRERARNRGKSFVGDALMIGDRPADVGDRAVPGHWEGDLMLGPAVSFQEVVPSVRIGKTGVTTRPSFRSARNEHASECPTDALSSRGDGRRRDLWPFEPG